MSDASFVVEKWSTIKDFLGGPWAMLIALGLIMYAVFWPMRRPTKVQPAPVRQPLSALLDELGVLFRAAGSPAYELADRMLDRMCELLIVPHEPGIDHRPTAAHHLALLVNNCVRDEGRRKQALFTNAMQRLPDSGFEDDKRVQEIFGDYYRLYLSLRYWVSTLSGLAGTLLVDIPEYQRWRDHEREYFRRLRDLIAHDRFATLRRKVEEVGLPD